MSAKGAAAALSVAEPPRFSLDALIREVLAEAEEPSPQELAPIVAERIPPEEVPALLLPFLSRRIGDVNRAERRRLHGSPYSPRNDDAVAVLGQRINLGRGRWELLANCTAKELVDVVASYRSQAEALIHQGLRYQRLLERLQEAKAATVADLPWQEVKTILGPDLVQEAVVV